MGMVLRTLVSTPVRKVDIRKHKTQVFIRTVAVVP